MATDVTAIIGARAGLRAFSEALLPGTVGAKSATLGELVRRRMGSRRCSINSFGRSRAACTPPTLTSCRSTRSRPACATRCCAPDRSPARCSSCGDLRLARGRRSRASAAAFSGSSMRCSTTSSGSASTFACDPGRPGSEPDAVSVGRGAVRGRVVVAAPGLLELKAGAPTRVILATLVVDQPLLDAAPRGTGVLVADGCAGHPGARAHPLDREVAVARRARGRQARAAAFVRRLAPTTWPRSRERMPRHCSACRSPRAAVVDFDRVEWYRPARANGSP